jgi:hypothetical protein
VFSESAALPIRDIVEWADEEAALAEQHLALAGRFRGEPLAEPFHRAKAATYQARARWLYETLAAATVDREKT